MGVSISFNQTEIPVLKSADDTVNQIQQNINKVLRNSNNKVVALGGILTKTEIIGEVKFASLTLSQFQAIAGPGWVQANGQNVVGSQYSLLTKNNSVPTVAVVGVNAFIRIN